MITTWRQRLGLLALLLAPILLLAALLAADQAIPPHWPYWIEQGQLVVSDDPPRHVSLPWVDSQRQAASRVMRATLEVEFAPAISAQSAVQTWAVLLPRPLVSFELSINGQFVAARGSMTSPVSWLRWPVLVEFPGSLLHPGNNQLSLSVASESQRLHLPALLVGPADVLGRTHTSLRLFAVGAVRAVVIALTLLAVLVFGLYLLRPGDGVYGWFALTLMLWAVHTAHDLIEAIPIANRNLWFALSYAQLGGFVVSACVFIHRMLGVRPRRLEALLWLFVASGGATLLALAWRCGHCFYSAAQWAWVPLINLVGLYAVVRLAVHAWRDRRPEFGWLLAAAWLALVVGVRDYLWEIQVLPWGSTYYLAYASAIVLVVFAAILLRRFAAALAEAEHLNRDLEQRVAAKASELESNYQVLRDTEQQRTRLAERALIMRDMHDNLGGHLVQALAILDTDQTSTDARDAVQRCLTDLRVTLDASRMAGGDVVALLADFRHSIERGLRRLGIELRLAMTDMPDRLDLDSNASIHLLRIVQEAINNVIKHAHATTIDLRLTCQGSRLIVEVADNGTGLSGKGEGGHGLDNMRWRADLIGARLTVADGEPGTRVCVELSLR